MKTKERDYKKEFISEIQSLAYKHGIWTIWNDFLYVSAVSMSNIVKTNDWQEREENYKRIVEKYKENERQQFAKLFAILMMALEENPSQDFLGEIYHKLRLEQEQKGQFFTPYNICQMMAEINFDGTKESLDKENYISVSDPACGAGAMLIAFANVCKEHDVNYQRKVLFEAQDIDRTAVLMCYVQLSLLGCMAVVIRGDSLLKPGIYPENDVWYTPMYYLNYKLFNNTEEENRIA